MVFQRDILLVEVEEPMEILLVVVEGKLLLEMVSHQHHHFEMALQILAAAALVLDQLPIMQVMAAPEL